MDVKEIRPLELGLCFVMLLVTGASVVLVAKSVEPLTGFYVAVIGSLVTCSPDIWLIYEGRPFLPWWFGFVGIQGLLLAMGGYFFGFPLAGIGSPLGLAFAGLLLAVSRLILSGQIRLNTKGK